MKRQEAGARAISFAASVPDLSRDLAPFPWDCESPLGVMTRAHVLAVLDRYSAGQLSAEAVEDWANLLEGRDDIAFEPGFETEVKDAVWRLSNPFLEGGREQLDGLLLAAVRGALKTGAA
ncbi:MAG: hypothetical protein ABR576_01270 [Thermoanaerobaculia bacterium]